MQNEAYSFTMLKQAHIYLANEAKPAIVAAMNHNLAGICYEQDEAVVIESWRKSDALVPAVRSALESFSFHDKNLRDTKLTDWAAYKASKARSVRDFQSTYLRISVAAANEAELCYIAQASPLDEDEISLRLTINRHGDEEMKRKLLRLFDACSRWNVVKG
ncbi:MAG TPA: hypothetical protein PKA41_10775 [Verrucomicrobiota bacterium]|nr:hypothetical protein [Verrucomicrobiota bacterium]